MLRALRRYLILGLAGLLCTAVLTTAGAKEPPTPRDALELVRAHAEAMLRCGTDHYEAVHTHFFTQMIDLRTMAAPTQRTAADWAAEARQWNEDTDYGYWGKCVKPLPVGRPTAGASPTVHA